MVNYIVLGKNDHLVGFKCRVTLSTFTLCNCPNRLQNFFIFLNQKSDPFTLPSHLPSTQCLAPTQRSVPMDGATIVLLKVESHSTGPPVPGVFTQCNVLRVRPRCRCQNLLSEGRIIITVYIQATPCFPCASADGYTACSQLLATVSTV